MFKDELGVGRGDVIDGKYRIDDVIGVGGMAIVLAAHHLQLDHRVAIKALRRDARVQSDTVQRFRREARAAVKVRGEHVARVFDVGTLPNGAPYMVMEYLEGVDLSEWLRRHGALPIVQAVDFILQACVALAEAHALGIVHRDLKPANLFVTRAPDGSRCIKVLDFGISKRAPGLGSSNITQVAMLIGSPLYMSPEQMRAPRSVDARSDIWSLGVILYELLAGVVPFRSETVPELAHRITSEAAQPLRRLRPEVPQGLADVVHRCMDKKARNRYASVADLAAALAPHAGAAGAKVGKHVADIARTIGHSLPPTERPAPPRASLRLWPHAGTISSRRRIRVGITAAAALSLSALVWVEHHGVPSPIAAPEQSVDPASLAAGESHGQPAPPVVLEGAPQPKLSAHEADLPEGVTPPTAAAVPDEAPKPAASKPRVIPARKNTRPASRPVARTRPPKPNRKEKTARALADQADKPDASVGTLRDDTPKRTHRARRTLDVRDPFR